MQRVSPPKDEQAIRDLVAEWARASEAGDVSAVSALMSEDAVFLAPGHSPMLGRDAFLASFEQALNHVRMEVVSDIREIQISGNLAFCWNWLYVTVTPRGDGESRRRSGPTLSVFKKTNGAWRLIRDANLLSDDTQA